MSVARETSPRGRHLRLSFPTTRHRLRPKSLRFSTTDSSTPTEVATESATGSTPMPATVTTVEITTGSTDSGPTPPAVTEMTATPGPTVTSEPSGSTGGAGPGGQGPGAGATPDGESSGSTGATGPGGQGPGAGNTPDGDQNGPSGTAPPGAQGPGASNSTGGEPSGSTGATGSGGQGPGVGATPDGGPSGSPVTAAPEGQGPGGANSTGGVTGVPVTQGPGGENTEKPEIEVPIGQYNTSNSGQFIATYFTIGTGNDTAIPIRFGQNIIDQLIRENSTVFRFNLQVRTSGAVTKAFDTLTQLASLTNIRQENEIDNEEENEVGTSDSTFVSALDRVNKTSTINNTNCINTIKLVLRKVQFTDARTGKLYPCDLSQPPYVEIVDTYNNSISQRFCYLNEDVTIHSFGDQMFGYVVTNGDPNIIPDIRAIQEKEKYCCGGVFYGDFRKPLIITSPNYPSSYNADMRCPYVFRCNVDYPECVIRLDFESFALSPNAMGRSRRQAESGNGTAATTQAPYVPPTGSDFNRTICAGEDVVRVSQCDSISTVNAREFCADNPPSQVYTGYKEVLLYFNSNDDRQNQGFVVKFTPKDKRKWIYSNAELEPECTCANNLPNQIRKFFRQRNKNKKNKNKNTTLRRVKREKKKNMKEKRKAEKKERIPGRKTEKGRNEKKNAKGQAKEKKKGKKNRKMKEKQGKKKNRKMKKGKKSKKEEKKAEKAKRKGKLSNKKEKRLGNKKKNGKEVEDRAMNGRTNRKRQQYPWLVSVTQYERPLLEEKSSSDRPIERICGGTLLSDSYVLTTTSCCTYCA
ncbi:hypothetical protein C7M84_013969 [Penaeus vannamei]|uniref:CUB domain-containing protein n=1 Tax=Penaeus vannamei TaxID=6689 RepID=A0A3R7M5T8_PENVA|nr:hypothetical protein C7M84_013969 [Penaeus vannamei]